MAHLEDDSDLDAHWLLDISGLSEEAAEAVCSLVKENHPNLDIQLVDSRSFLTLHMDFETVEVIYESLVDLKGNNPVAASLKSIVAEWLANARHSERP